MLRGLVAVAIGACIFAVSEPVGAVPPYPDSEAMGDVAFDWTTHIRLAPGSDNWNITWGADGHQYTVWGDGGGFGGTNGDGRVSLGVGRVEGPADAYQGFNINGGVDPESGNSDWPDGGGSPGGKSYGLISIEGVLYMWVGPGSGATSYQSQTLFRSDDDGYTWTEPGWQFVQAEEIGLPTFVQFGQEYAGARDEFVYMYASRVESPTFPTLTPGIIDLFRAPANDLSNQDAYEFFTGVDGNGDPMWSSDHSVREPVFEDPEGVSFATSAIHIAQAGRYVLCTEHGAGTAGGFGMYDAPEPWGPWTTVSHTDAFGEGEVAVSTFFWNFSNKWLSEDGSEFVMVFTGVGENDSWNSVEGTWSFDPVPGGDTGTDSGSDDGPATTDDTAGPTSGSTADSGDTDSGPATMTGATADASATGATATATETAGGTGADSDDGGGCGCRTSTTSFPWWMLCLLATRRRRLSDQFP